MPNLVEIIVQGRDQGAKKLLDDVGGSAQRTQPQFASMAGGITRMAGALGLAVTAKTVWDKTVAAGFIRVNDLEDANKRLTQMGLNTGQVDALMAGLTATVTGTAFKLNEGAGIMANFVASGMDIDEVNKRLTLTADTAAFAQAPLGEIGDIFQRIQSEGKLTGETLNMLQVRGVPALDLLASAAGVTGEEMRGMISGSQVDADRFFALWEDGSQGFGENNIKMADSAKSMGDTTRGALANAETAASRLGASFAEDLAPMLRDAADAFTGLVNGTLAWKESLDGWNSSGAQVVENLGGWNATGLDVIKMLLGGKEATKGFGEVTREAAEEAEGAAGSTEVYEEALERAEQAAKDAKDAIKDLTTALFESGNEALDLEDKQDSLADAIDKAREASEDDESTKRDQRAALRDVASASHDVIETMIDQEASTKDVRDASESARRKFIDVARQLGLTKGEARRLADQYGLIPDDVETAVDLIGTERARAKAEALRAKIAQIKSRTVYINAVTRASGPSSILAQFKASGGIVGAGIDGTAQGGGPRSNRVLVGEQGPEVVELPTGSRVIPSVDQAMDRGQGGGGGSVVLELHSGGSRLDDLLLEVLRNSIRVKGGDVQKVLGSG